jgi:hypothetical protein
VLGVQVHVAGRPAGVEGREQYSALQDEHRRLGRRSQPGQKPFEGVQGQELVGGALVATGLVLQVEVGAARDGLAGRSHSKTSSERRNGVLALGKWAASSSSRAGWEPRLVSHLRSASLPSSGPSSLRSRKASMMQRSAL